MREENEVSSLHALYVVWPGTELLSGAGLVTLWEFVAASLYRPVRKQFQTCLVCLHKGGYRAPGSVALATDTVIPQPPAAATIQRSLLKQQQQQWQCQQHIASTFLQL